MVSIDLTEAQDGGLLKTVLSQGQDPDKHPSSGELANISYVCRLQTDPTVECDRNDDFEFRLGNETSELKFLFTSAIKGLELGVRSMCRGERALLECRADYAYGEVGAPEKGIPPNATLIFDVYLYAWTGEGLAVFEQGLKKCIELWEMISMMAFFDGETLEKIKTAKTAAAAGERPAERPKRATAAADGKPKAAKAKGQSGGGPSIFRGIFIEVGNAFTLIDAANEFKKEFAKGAGNRRWWKIIKELLKLVADLDFGGPLGSCIKCFTGLGLVTGGCNIVAGVMDLVDAFEEGWSLLIVLRGGEGILRIISGIADVISVFCPALRIVQIIRTIVDGKLFRLLKMFFTNELWQQPLRFVANLLCTGMEKAGVAIEEYGSKRVEQGSWIIGNVLKFIGWVIKCIARGLRKLFS